jgi:hypothetical protein
MESILQQFRLRGFQYKNCFRPHLRHQFQAEGGVRVPGGTHVENSVNDVK